MYITNMSTSGDVKLEIESLLANGEQNLAWAAMVRYLEADPKGGAYHLVTELSDQLDPASAELKPLKVALLGTFTLEPMVPLLKAHALCSRFLLKLYTGGYNAWQQEVLSEKSGLRRFEPEVVFAAWRLEEMSPSLVYDFPAMSEAAVAQELAKLVGAIESALTGLRHWSRAKIVLHNAPIPTTPAFGIIDHQLPTGQIDAFCRLNSKLLDLAKEIPGLWILDYGRLIANIGERRWYDARLWGLARLPLSNIAMHALVDHYVAYLRAFCGFSRKVLVLDLDDTLWGGVVGEVGTNGIELGSDYPGSAFVEFQRTVLSLYHRGVVLAINSKNNEVEALEVIANHPAMVLRAEHFAAKRISWNDKVANMEELSEELGLNLDSFVFVDNSQVECERMRSALPQVLTVCLSEEAGEHASQIRNLRAFDVLRYSEEDRHRGELYRKDVARKKLQASIGSLEEFYESLEMQLLIERVNQQSAVRATVLTQRTNQFNLTTRRLTCEEINGLIERQEHEVYGIRLRDRFGDNGMIGLMIVRHSEGQMVIEDFLISCRVIGRTVETAALTFLIRRAKTIGMAEVLGLFSPTNKNTLAANFYPEHGFSCVEETKNGILYRLPAEKFDREFPKWFQVTLPNKC